MAEASDVPSQYLCPICREVLKKPTSTRDCRHRFCESCLHQTRPSDDGVLLCPLCRLPFRMCDVFHDTKFEREMSVVCFTCHGCSSKLPLSMYNIHQTLCKKLNTETVQVPLNPQAAAAPNRSTFKCPLCNEDNLDCAGLREHINQYHANSTTSVVCPVCASMPWGNPSQKSGHFVAHLNLRHKFEYETYVDYCQDEDTALQQTLRESLNDL